MKKQLIRLGLAIAVCFSICISASAASSKDSEKSPVVVDETDCSIWSTIFEDRSRYSVATWIQTDDNSALPAGRVKIQSYLFDSSGRLEKSSESVLQSDYYFHVAYTDFRAASDYAYGWGTVWIKNSSGRWMQNDTDNTPQYNLKSSSQLVSLDAFLENGVYPRNSKGDTYGSMVMESIVGETPDLIAAQGSAGECGYVKKSDLFADYDDAKRIKYVGRYIPLYDLEGNEIGTFMVRFNKANEFVGMDIDDVRAKLEDGRSKNPVLWDLADQSLINGAYPTNANGETYGHPMLRDLVGYLPDLIQASNKDGLQGYVRDSDAPVVKINESGEAICNCPLYNQDGCIIGEFEVGGTTSIQTVGKTVPEIYKELSIK